MKDLSPQAALAARVEAAAEVLLGSAQAGGPDTGARIDALVRSVRADADDQRLWLLMTCLSTVMPEPELLRAAGRFLRTRTAGQSTDWLLDQCLTQARHHGQAGRTVRILTGAVLVDVDYSARNDVHRGIQRVVRQVMPRWGGRPRLHPVAWTPKSAMFRSLDATETARILSWSGSAAAASGEASSELVIPWGSIVVLAEVPVAAVCPRLAALAETSGNALTAIGYDMVPLTSAHMLAAAHANRFVQYLAVVKHMTRVAGISVSATTEFQGFAAMLPAQGLPGPVVAECRLPTEMGSVAGDVLPEVEPDTRPSVLSIGSLEPRKNPLTLLHAAERLWREGHDFSLTIVSAGAIAHEPQAHKRIQHLQALGRPLELRTAITDDELRTAYAKARFTVFCTLHEGYGLPVAESLSLGTPVVATGYGSTREIVEHGGALLVDPRDDESVVNAMRTLLTDDGELARLTEDLRHRPQRSWDTYADELWQHLVEPCMATLEQASP